METAVADPDPSRDPAGPAPSHAPLLAAASRARAAASRAGRSSGAASASWSRSAALALARSARPKVWAEGSARAAVPGPPLSRATARTPATETGPRRRPPPGRRLRTADAAAGRGAAAVGAGRTLIVTLASPAVGSAPDPAARAARAPTATAAATAAAARATRAARPSQREARARALRPARRQRGSAGGTTARA